MVRFFVRSREVKVTDMNDMLHRMDTLGSCKTVICGKQKMHWIEFQLLDEQRRSAQSV
jgi:hypothetical protein